MSAPPTGPSRRWAWPLVPLYAAGLAVKDGLRRAGVLPTRRLDWPVVSVGSLSAGGAGKTPVVIALAELLHERGWTVDVLSRGYGREGKGVERVDPEAADAAALFGDEPVLIARRTGVPVWVGAERFAAGVAAEANGGRERVVHLLDDGFQHRGLARAMDVVLVTATDLDDALLPAGNRRERLSALRRADVVVLRAEERAALEPRVRGLVSREALVWEVRRRITFPGAVPVLNADVPTYGYIVFAAIARPANFVDMLKDAGVVALEVVTFPDHHVYTIDDIHRLVETRGLSVGNRFVTTEKDAVKLSPSMRARLEAVAPLVVARLDCEFVKEADVTQELEARIS